MNMTSTPTPVSGPAPDDDYDARWQRLQRAAAPFGETGGLGNALRKLVRDQIAAGAVPAYDRESVRIPGSGACPPYFLVQANPRRLARLAKVAAVAATAAAGELATPDQLDRDYIRRTNPMQLGLEIAPAIGGRPLIAWVQPFPMAHSHCTVAAANACEQQEWVDAAGQDRCAAVLSDTVALATALGPDWICFFNGKGSYTQRRYHLQVFERAAADYPPFPLELATQAGVCTDPLPDAPPFVAGYPLAVLHFQGAPETVSRLALAWLHAWFRPGHRPRRERSANVIARARAEDGPVGSEVTLWIAPRSVDLTGSVRIPSARLAALEVLGELVVTSEADLARLDAGAFTYADLAGTLADVEPSEVRELRCPPI